MNTQRPRKNFKTSDGTPEPMNQIQNFGEQAHQNQASYQKQNFNNSNNSYHHNNAASNNSKKIKKPKNKLNLNKFHQPIFKKESEGKLLKKKARDLQRLVEKEGVAEEIIESKKVELQEVTSKLEQRKKKQKRLERKVKFLQQKYKSVMNVEMKKVLRSLEKNEKLISQTLDDEKRNDLFAKKKELQMKYNYIKYFPKDKKYLSLFPNQENEKMVALRNKIMKEIQSRIEQKEKYLNKIELDPKNKEELENKQKDKKQKKKVEQSEESEEDSQMDIEKDSEDDSSEEDEEKEVKMPKLGKKHVDNFFVAPNSGVDEKSQVKIIGKDGRVLKTEQKKKALSDSDSDSSDDESD
ncbi:hypothetical protein TTHERM_00347930 (macronuclear) [Tetrahymena thermophila SB210]|uniref:rRNA-processing protein EFG1 n=1 Tax=Tetrahymena thermophila (strain SB210) TaxID=312017 RepID=I7M9S1_TETTS|nr:hypothetical protein TTHERM_00347930 [Tetrahymena thermophila SB210]EAS02703.2 hypothetical protein TTHERM_00347930 [Tetrahymena thermophila SB210]|eukprot:XP_001022948.2 hypothetical protein TTHERM_00347930 [Tetrahymena thermophila SB210]